MPFWFWLIIAGAICAAIGIHLFIYKRYHYICSKCLKIFKPNSFFRSMLALNNANYRRVRCSYCHYKDWAKMEKKDNKHIDNILTVS
jgi:DNA-directed RNA polymerase subunit RPC12/RpoP